MPRNAPKVHPYIPNSAPAAKEAMLREVGAATEDELYQDMPGPFGTERTSDSRSH